MRVSVIDGSDDGRPRWEIVALIAIGPKDLPIAIKAIAETLKKGRRMASEFQGHVDEMVREANLHEVRDQINELRTMDVKGRILNAVDGDGAMRRTINDDPFKTDHFAPHRDATPAAVTAPIAPADHAAPAPVEQITTAPSDMPPVAVAAPPPAPPP